MRSWNIDKIIHEVDKCLLVCSCCHREMHAGIHDDYIQEIISLTRMP